MEKYIKRCINSILTQTHIPDEIILVDDGSTDRSGEFCNEYVKRYPFIKYIKIDNVGSAAARKAGTKASKGEYIAYVDGDDVLEQTMYEKYMEQVNLHHPDAVIGRITKDYKDYCVEIQDRIIPKIYEEDNYEELIDKMVDCGPFSDYGIHASLCSKVFRKETVAPYIYEVDERIVFGEDAAVLYPFLINSLKICVTELTGYHWVMREDSKTHSKDSNYLSELNYLEDYLRDRIPEQVLLPFMLNQIQNALHRQYGFCDSYAIKAKYKNDDEVIYLFPFERIPRGSGIIIYGNGLVGKSFCRQIKHSGYCRIIAIADRNADKEGDYHIIQPTEIYKKDYDYVLVAVSKKEMAMEMKEVLKKEGINEEKIIWSEYRI
ncbi:MAG: glycosyltransferase [Lachnospiraceae bacterium]|nr:glycosyltransferase [Lachnospiraceae bacterium]